MRELNASEVSEISGGGFWRDLGKLWGRYIGSLPNSQAVDDSLSVNEILEIARKSDSSGLT